MAAEEDLLKVGLKSTKYVDDVAKLSGEAAKTASMSSKITSALKNVGSFTLKNKGLIAAGGIAGGLLTQNLIAGKSVGQAITDIPATGIKDIGQSATNAAAATGEVIGDTMSAGTNAFSKASGLTEFWAKNKTYIYMAFIAYVLYFVYTNFFKTNTSSYNNNDYNNNNNNGYNNNNNNGYNNNNNGYNGYTGYGEEND